MTMTSTMPVVITAMEEVCTNRIHRLRGVRKRAAEEAVAGPENPL